MTKKKKPKKKVAKKRAKNYDKKLKIHATFDQAMRVLVGEPKPKK